MLKISQPRKYPFDHNPSKFTIEYHVKDEDGEDGETLGYIYSHDNAPFLFCTRDNHPLSLSDLNQLTNFLTRLSTNGHLDLH